MSVYAQSYKHILLDARSITATRFPPDTCAAFIIVPGSYNVACDALVINGANLNYAVIN